MGSIGRDPDWGAWDRWIGARLGKKAKSAFFGRFRMGAKKRPFFREDRTKKGI
jgi:hypothetical protein